MTAIQFLIEHNVSQEFAESFGITWDKDYLYIPIRDHEGNLVGKKPRNLHHGEEGHPLAKEPKYKNIYGSNIDTLFNWHLVKDKPNIVLCEGEIDALKLTEEGIPAISSSGGAGTIGTKWVELLADKNLWICYDNDAAGSAGVRKLFEYFPSAKSIELPEGVKDVSEYFFLTGTKEEFLKLPNLGSGEWHAKHRDAKYDLLSAQDFSNMEIEAMPWLIQNVMYAQGFCVIYGSEGTGKSFLTLSLAKAVANGTPWLDKFNTKQTNILFIDKENPDSMTKRRLAGLNMTQENIYWLKHPEEYELTNMNGEASEFAVELTSIIEEREIGLIVIDSLVDLMVGNENSSEHTMAFFSGIKKLYPKIAYLTIHHENKPSQGVSRSDSQKLRGSSNLTAQPNTIFRLEPVAKSKTEMTMLQTKARDAQKLSKFMIRMKVKPVISGNPNDTVVTGFEYVGEVEDTMADPTKIQEIQRAIRIIIEKNGVISRPEVLNLGTKITADRAVNLLVESGELLSSKQGRIKIFKFNIFNQDDLDDIATPIV